MITELVAADIGGTHARFALARIEDCRVVKLDEPLRLNTADHRGLREAWRAFSDHLGRPLPSAAALAFAYPVENALPETGVISIVGPGTGLGVGLVMRENCRYRVVATEGGNMDFSPRDELDDRLMATLRKRHGHVSAERVISGAGLRDIYAAIAGVEAPYVDDRELWQAALDGSDPQSAAALDRFCLCLGSFAGNVSLAHGANTLVLAGGLGLRLRDHLRTSGFAEALVAKAEYRSILEQLPVKLITHPEPGLYGAVAAFAARLAGSP
jgi:glucokinase